ncbi:MAG: DNA mismatch repair endonuclease MutL [Oscillospiraceae bacterium]|nr:DNA mismatch repair endonuclease MutL [Oscillospiraceae bacterium]
MPHIQQLSPHVADLIAAGEVVERPASVVKELLENAMDAGATAVTVELQSGGMTYLRVSDNGCGIESSELPTAFLRHATSKLRTAEDLAAIGTLGFRGEALAAISAVSRLDIFSRVHSAQSGASLHLEGGVPGAVQDAGCPEGTSVIVRDLFYNTPARLKFMKRDSAEASAISGLVAHLALSHPGISFKLVKDGEETLHTPGDGVLRSAVYAALGREFALKLVEVSCLDGSLSAHGFLTHPLALRGTRGMQTFFVNGRFVKSQLLTAALEEAYANRIMKGKFPGCVLFVDLPCDMVDVNVHPAKTVVKFLNEKAIFDLVYHGAMDALDGCEAPKPASAKDVRQVQNPRADFFTAMTAGQYRARGAEKAAKPAAPQFKTSVPAFPSELSGKLPFSDVVRRAAGSAPQVRPAAPAASANAPAVPFTAGAYEASPVPAAAPAAKDAPAEEPEQLTLVPETAAPWRIAGEVLDTYIVCEDGEKNVWLIDKHAAHERINFDRLKANAGPIMPQALLTPLVADFPAAEYTALVEQFSLLREFGFACEEFGDGSILIREIPADIDSGDAVSALEELAGKLAAAHSADPASARDALLHTIACKTAIKGGWKTSERELRVLVDKVQSGEVQFCPHGRPVKVKLSRYELEKMFKRA